MQEMSPYEVLEVDEACSAAVLKAAYQRLILVHHPDRKSRASPMPAAAAADAGDAFVRIQQAWEVLGDASRRAEHDKRQARATKTATTIIAETVPLGEFELQGQDPERWYSKTCRCGEDYEISVEDFQQGHTTVQCNGCSLYVRIAVEE